MEFFEIGMESLTAASKNVARGLTRKEAKELASQVDNGAIYRYGIGRRKWGVMEGVTDRRGVGPWNK